MGSLLNEATSKSFVVFFLCTTSLVSVNCGTFHVWQNETLYFINDTLLTLQEAQRACAEIGGRLPSVHSKVQVEDLAQIIGQEPVKKVWLGAEKYPHNSVFIHSFMYKWTDGTPFDYHEWHESDPNCEASCCGVGLVSDDESSGNKLFDEKCDFKMNLVCIPRLLTDEAAKIWLASRMSAINSSMEESLETDRRHQQSIDSLNQTLSNLMNDGELQSKLASIQDTFSGSIAQLHIDKDELSSKVEGLNETLKNIKENWKNLREQMSRIENQLVTSFTAVNESTLKNSLQFDHLKNHLSDVSSQTFLRISSLSHQIRQTNEKVSSNQMFLKTLDSHLDLFLWFLFICIALAVLIFYKKTN